MQFSTIGAAIIFPLAIVLSLGASAILVVRLERLAGNLRLSEAMLGLVVALAADSPEITAAITASTHGQKDVGVGVVLGSNVFNLAALLGVAAIVAQRVHLHRKVVVLEGGTATWVALVSVLVLTTPVGAGAGLILALFVVVPYLVVSGCSAARLRRLRVPTRAVAWLHSAIVEEELEIATGVRRTTNAHLDGTVAFLSLVVVVGASALLERSASVLGSHFHLPDLLVGGVVLAAATSIPNAVGAVFLALRGRGAAVLSEAMNSNMLNVLIGLLVPGIFLGLDGTVGGGALVAWWYTGLTVVSLAMAYLGRGLGRRQGVVIITCYLAFVIVALSR